MAQLDWTEAALYDDMKRGTKMRTIEENYDALGLELLVKAVIYNGGAIELHGVWVNDQLDVLSILTDKQEAEVMEAIEQGEDK